MRVRLRRGAAGVLLVAAAAAWAAGPVSATAVSATAVSARAVSATAVSAASVSATALSATAAAAPPNASPAAAAAFLLARQTASGGFAEPGAEPTPGLSFWAVIGLAAAGRAPQSAQVYLRAAEGSLALATDIELAVLAEAALGMDVGALAERVRGLAQPSGQIGPALNSTFWGVMALHAAGVEVPAASVAAIRRGQTRSGGWAWRAGSGADADDTAAAVLALRAAGVPARDRAVARGLAYLRTCEARTGGFGSVPGALPNAQTTAWAAQAFLAAGRDPGPRTWGYLASLQRRDGSIRFSAAYATTPVWVTSYALVALERRWYPIVPR